MSRRQYGRRLLSESNSSPARLNIVGLIPPLVAELILTSISPLFLINALIDLWQRHMETRNEHHDSYDLNSRDAGVSAAHTQGAGVNATTRDDGVNVHTDREGRVGITWVKIVSA